MMKCRFCNELLEDGSLFCQYCGRMVTDEDHNPVIGFLCFFGCFLLILFLLVLLIVWIQFTSNTTNLHFTALLNKQVG